MTRPTGRAVRDRPMRVEVRIAQVAERTPAWRRLMERLLSPPSCKGDGVLVDYRQEDRETRLTDLT